MSDEQQPWDIVRELVWVGHPLMIAAANEIEDLRRRLHQQNEYSLKLQHELERLRVQA